MLDSEDDNDSCQLVIDEDYVSSDVDLSLKFEQITVLHRNDSIKDITEQNKININSVNEKTNDNNAMILKESLPVVSETVDKDLPVHCEPRDTRNFKPMNQAVSKESEHKYEASSFNHKSNKLYKASYNLKKAQSSNKNSLAIHSTDYVKSFLTNNIKENLIDMIHNVKMSKTKKNMDTCASFNHESRKVSVNCIDTLLSSTSETLPAMSENRTVLKVNKVPTVTKNRPFEKNAYNVISSNKKLSSLDFETQKAEVNKLYNIKNKMNESEVQERPVVDKRLDKVQNKKQVRIVKNNAEKGINSKKCVKGNNSNNTNAENENTTNRLSEDLKLIDIIEKYSSTLASQKEIAELSVLKNSSNYISSAKMKRICGILQTVSDRSIISDHDVNVRNEYNEKIENVPKEKTVLSPKKDAKCNEAGIEYSDMFSEVNVKIGKSVRKKIKLQHTIQNKNNKQAKNKVNKSGSKRVQFLLDSHDSVPVVTSDVFDKTNNNSEDLKSTLVRNDNSSDILSRENQPEPLVGIHSSDNEKRVMKETELTKITSQKEDKAYSNYLTNSNQLGVAYKNVSTVSKDNASVGSMLAREDNERDKVSKRKLNNHINKKSQNNLVKGKTIIDYFPIVNIENTEIINDNKDDTSGGKILVEKSKVDIITSAANNVSVDEVITYDSDLCYGKNMLWNISEDSTVKVKRNRAAHINLKLKNNNLPVTTEIQPIVEKVLHDVTLPKVVAKRKKDNQIQARKIKKKTESNHIAGNDPKESYDTVIKNDSKEVSKQVNNEQENIGVKDTKVVAGKEAKTNCRRKRKRRVTKENTSRFVNDRHHASMTSNSSNVMLENNETNKVCISEINDIEVPSGKGKVTGPSRRKTRTVVTENEKENLTNKKSSYNSEPVSQIINENEIGGNVKEVKDKLESKEVVSMRKIDTKKKVTNDKSDNQIQYLSNKESLGKVLKLCLEDKVNQICETPVIEEIKESSDSVKDKVKNSRLIIDRSETLLASVCKLPECKSDTDQYKNNRNCERNNPVVLLQRLDIKTIIYGETSNESNSMASMEKENIVKGTDICGNTCGTVVSHISNEKKIGIEDSEHMKVDFNHVEIKEDTISKYQHIDNENNTASKDQHVDSEDILAKHCEINNVVRNELMDSEENSNDSLVIKLSENENISLEDKFACNNMADTEKINGEEIEGADDGIILNLETGSQNNCISKDREENFVVTDEKIENDGNLTHESDSLIVVLSDDEEDNTQAYEDIVIKERAKQYELKYDDVNNDAVIVCEQVQCEMIVVPNNSNNCKVTSIQQTENKESVTCKDSQNNETIVAIQEFESEKNIVLESSDSIVDSLGGGKDNITYISKNNDEDARCVDEIIENIRNSGNSTDAVRDAEELENIRKCVLVDAGSVSKEGLNQKEKDIIRDIDGSNINDIILMAEEYSVNIILEAEYSSINIEKVQQIENENLPENTNSDKNTGKGQENGHNILSENGDYNDETTAMFEHEKIQKNVSKNDNGVVVEQIVEKESIIYENEMDNGEAVEYVENKTNEREENFDVRIDSPVGHDSHCNDTEFVENTAKEKENIDKNENDTSSAVVTVKKVENERSMTQKSRKKMDVEVEIQKIENNGYTINNLEDNDNDIIIVQENVNVCNSSSNADIGNITYNDNKQQSSTGSNNSNFSKVHSLNNILKRSFSESESLDNTFDDFSSKRFNNVNTQCGRYLRSNSADSRLCVESIKDAVINEYCKNTLLSYEQTDVKYNSVPECEAISNNDIITDVQVISCKNNKHKTGSVSYDTVNITSQVKGKNSPLKSSDINTNILITHEGEEMGVVIDLDNNGKMGFHEPVRESFALNNSLNNDATVVDKQTESQTNVMCQSECGNSQSADHQIETDQHTFIVMESVLRHKGKNISKDDNGVVIEQMAEKEIIIHEKEKNIGVEKQQVKNNGYTITNLEDNDIIIVQENVNVFYKNTADITDDCSANLQLLGNTENWYRTNLLTPNLFTETIKESGEHVSILNEKSKLIMSTPNDLHNDNLSGISQSQSLLLMDALNDQHLSDQSIFEAGSKNTENVNQENHSNCKESCEAKRENFKRLASSVKELYRRPNCYREGDPDMRQFLVYLKFLYYKYRKVLYPDRFCEKSAEILLSDSSGSNSSFNLNNSQPIGNSQSQRHMELLQEIRSLVYDYLRNLLNLSPEVHDERSCSSRVFDNNSSVAQNNVFGSDYSQPEEDAYTSSLSTDLKRNSKLENITHQCSYSSSSSGDNVVHKPKDLNSSLNCGMSSSKSISQDKINCSISKRFANVNTQRGRYRRCNSADTLIPDLSYKTSVKCSHDVDRLAGKEPNISRTSNTVYEKSDNSKNDTSAVNSSSSCAICLTFGKCFCKDTLNTPLKQNGIGCSSRDFSQKCKDTDYCNQNNCDISNICNSQDSFISVIREKNIEVPIVLEDNCVEKSVSETTDFSVPVTSGNCELSTEKQPQYGESIMFTENSRYIFLHLDSDFNSADFVQ